MRGTDYFTTIAARPPLTRLHPRMGEFFKEYLAGEKAIDFNGRLVLNAHFPPYPSRAFDRMARHFLGDDESGEASRLYSITWAVTNRCDFACWHCYNAGRSQVDLPLAIARRVAGDLQDLGATMVTLTGGEPLLRDDLEEIAASFDQRCCVIVGTTGWGLTAARARALKQAGVWGVGISLDSDIEHEHNSLRGRAGAFRAALDAIATARQAGLYVYVVSVATRQFLAPDRFMNFMRFAGRSGALEVHLLEPCPSGRLLGRNDIVLSREERRQIIEYQREVAADDELPILSTFTYLESADTFGCGAGRTHLYIDGSGELCPCNLVPLSFGNVADRPLPELLDRMQSQFRVPRAHCVGRILSAGTNGHALPTPPETSEEICRRHLPASHETPRFVQVRVKCGDSAGPRELTDAYDRVGADYDEFWLSSAGRPVEELVDRLELRGDERIFEAGCGTGFGTALLARQLSAPGHILAVDLSQGMLARARRRAASNVTFRHGDALAALHECRDLDLVFTAWVLGYIALAPFFKAAAKALKADGRVALVVHKERSPRRETDAFADIIARDPSLLTRRVSFDFPRDVEHLKDELRSAGLEAVEMWEDSAVFHYRTPGQVLEHLLKSGAGTVFHDAIDPARRERATADFLELLRASNPAGREYEVRHDFLGCIARPIRRGAR